MILKFVSSFLRKYASGIRHYEIYKNLALLKVNTTCYIKNVLYECRKVRYICAFSCLEVFVLCMNVCGLLLLFLLGLFYFIFYIYVLVRFRDFHVLKFNYIYIVFIFFWCLKARMVQWCFLSLYSYHHSETYLISIFADQLNGATDEDLRFSAYFMIFYICIIYFLKFASLLISS